MVRDNPRPLFHTYPLTSLDTLFKRKLFASVLTVKSKMSERDPGTSTTSSSNLETGSLWTSHEEAPPGLNVTQ